MGRPKRDYPEGKFVLDSNEGDVTAESIPLSIVYLLNGENNSFTPKYTSYTGLVWPGFENCNVFIAKEEFAATYKANNKFYGGSRVKSIDVDSDSEYGIIVKIDF